MTYTLKVFNTGQITLPKKWREKFDTNLFIGQETKGGLLITPLEILEEPQLVLEPEDEKKVVKLLKSGRWGKWEDLKKKYNL